MIIAPETDILPAAPFAALQSGPAAHGASQGTTPAGAAFAAEFLSFMEVSLPSGMAGGLTSTTPSAPLPAGAAGEPEFVWSMPARVQDAEAEITPPATDRYASQHLSVISAANLENPPRASGEIQSPAPGTQLPEKILLPTSPPAPSALAGSTGREPLGNAAARTTPVTADSPETHSPGTLPELSSQAGQETPAAAIALGTVEPPNSGTAPSGMSRIVPEDPGIQALNPATVMAAPAEPVRAQTHRNPPQPANSDDIDLQAASKTVLPILENAPIPAETELAGIPAPVTGEAKAAPLPGTSAQAASLAAAPLASQSALPPASAVPQHAPAASETELALVMSAGDPAAALDLQGAAPVFTTAPGAAPLMAPVTAGMPSGAAPAMATFVAVPAEIPAIFARAVQDPAGDRITIQLDPPELGRISIDFRFEGSALQHVTVTAETPEALRQLRQMHGELISALEQNGLGGKDMTFQQQTPQDRPQQDAPAGATARRQPEMIAVPGLTAPDAAGPRALAAGRLDIRL